MKKLTIWIEYCYHCPKSRNCTVTIDPDGYWMPKDCPLEDVEKDVYIPSHH